MARTRRTRRHAKRRKPRCRRRLTWKQRRAIAIRNLKKAWAWRRTKRRRHVKRRHVKRRSVSRRRGKLTKAQRRAIAIRNLKRARSTRRAKKLRAPVRKRHPRRARAMKKRYKGSALMRYNLRRAAAKKPHGEVERERIVRRLKEKKAEREAELAKMPADERHREEYRRRLRERLDAAKKSQLSLF